jgi:hypothetical protein
MSGVYDRTQPRPRGLVPAVHSGSGFLRVVTPLCRRYGYTRECKQRNAGHAEAETTRKGRVMAQKILTTFVDDLDGGEATGTVRFGLDGAEYEIDLSDKNTEALRGTLGKYVEVARRSSAGQRERAARHVGGRASRGSGVNTTAVRDYLRARPDLLNGRTLNERGRIPADFVSLVPEDIRYGRVPVPPVMTTPAPVVADPFTADPATDDPNAGELDTADDDAKPAEVADDAKPTTTPKSRAKRGGSRAQTKETTA